MRKFTKEISALLASAAVGATLCAGAATAAEPETEPTAGALAAEEECSTELVGTMMAEEETTTQAFEIVGTMMAEEETTTHAFEVEVAGETLPDDDIVPTEELEPLMGDIALPDGDIDPTEELPPLAGEPLPSDEDVSDPEEIPPIEGDMAPADGDINGDGTLGVTDAVALQRWLHGDPDIHPANLRAADLYPDGEIDVFDLSLMKKNLVGHSDDRRTDAG